MTPAEATSRPRKTVDDLMALPDDVRAELIGGEIYVTPSPTPDHQAVLWNLIRLLGNWAAARRPGRGFPELDVHLPSGDVVRPDVVFVAKENLSIVTDRVRGAPDLLVEIVSRNHPERDRIVKRDLYARNGVREYWIVEREDGAVQVLALDGASHAPAGYFGRGATVRSRAWPDLALPVDEILATGV
jgi:Uma2 family endonuclease